MGADDLPLLPTDGRLTSSGDAEPLLLREDGGGFGGGAVGRLGLEVAMLTGRRCFNDDVEEGGSFLLNESKLSSLEDALK